MGKAKDLAQKVLRMAKDDSLNVLIPYEMRNIEDIVFVAAGLKTYQREMERRRVNSIKQSIMETGGFWPWSPLVLNERGEVVDGGNRLTAVREANKEGAVKITRLPVSVIAFDTAQDEADFFCKINVSLGNMRPTDLWHARFLAGNPIAKALYMLESSHDSNLCNMIAIKGKQTVKSKFTVSDALLMINATVRNMVNNWAWIIDRAMQRDVEKAGHDFIKARVNGFMNFFLPTYGWNKQDNPVFYNMMGLSSTLIFYRLLKDNGILPDDLSSVVKKMQKDFPLKTFEQGKRMERVHLLVMHYNRRARQNKKIPLLALATQLEK